MTRALVSIGAIQILIMLVALVRAKLLATTLGPAAFGVMSTIDQVVLTALQVGTFSLPFNALRLMAKGHSQSGAAFQQMFAAFFRVLTGLSVLIAIIGVGLLFWRADAFGDDLAPYRGLLMIAMLGLPAIVLHILFMNTLAAAEAPAASAGLNLAVAFLLAAAAVAGAWASGIRGVYVATAGVGVISIAGTLVYLRTRAGVELRSPAVPLRRTLADNPDIVTHAGLVWAAISAHSLTLFTTRYIVLSALGPEQAGLLQAQLGLALTVGAVVAPMSALYLAPLVNRQTPMPERVATANGFAGRVILLLLLAGLPLILFPRFALGTLFSPAFEPAAHFFFVFLAWQFVYQVSNIYLQLLIGLDDVWFFAGITCAGYAVAVTLFPFLIPGMGTGGVGLALVAAMAVSGCGAALRLRARFGHAIGTTVWLRFAYLAAVLIGGGLLFSPETELVARGIAQRAAFAALALALAWWTLTAEERNRLRLALTRASRA